MAAVYFKTVIAEIDCFNCSSKTVRRTTVLTRIKGETVKHFQSVWFNKNVCSEYLSGNLETVNKLRHGGSASILTLLVWSYHSTSDVLILHLCASRSCKCKFCWKIFFTRGELGLLIWSKRCTQPP